MSPYPFRAASICGMLTMALLTSTASAQWYPVSANCVCRQPQPVANPCYQAIPMTTYRNVPVTEYRQVKQTVKRPVYSTEYVEKEVTAYRPVTEKKTVEVPTVTYESVTDCQPIGTAQNTGYGYPGQQFQQIPRMAQMSYSRRPTPYEYDPRPTFTGWMNRTSYSIRAALAPLSPLNLLPRPRHAFQPNRRLYDSRMGGYRLPATASIAPQGGNYLVPMTRQVPKYGTKKVTYNVTKMVAYKTKQKVPVQTVKYVDQEVVRTQPVTVMRAVPVGTRYVYNYSPIGNGTTQTALSPSPDPVSAESSDSPSRTANSADEKFESNLETGSGSNEFGGNEQGSIEPKLLEELPATAMNRSPSRVSIARAKKWFVHGRRPAVVSQPELIAPGVSVASK